jgi:hypothetical protein
MNLKAGSEESDRSHSQDILATLAKTMDTIRASESIRLKENARCHERTKQDVSLFSDG